MKRPSTDALSWQTDILTFRNRSLGQIRQQLEDHYGNSLNVKFADGCFPPSDSALRDMGEKITFGEIRIVLYLRYGSDFDWLSVYAVPVYARA